MDEQPLTFESHKPTPGIAFVALCQALCRMEKAELIFGIDFAADGDGQVYASVTLEGWAQDGD